MSGYFPYLRSGAIILNAVIFNYKLNQSNSIEEAFYSVHNKRIRGRKLLWDCYPKTVARTVFNSSMSPIEVMLNHSHYGVYSHALTSYSANMLFKGINSHDKSLRGLLSQYFKYSNMHCKFRLSTPDLRSCNFCIADDIENLGYAQWDLLHLLPQVSHCPRHGCMLNVDTIKCKDNFIQSMNFPIAEKSSRPIYCKDLASDGYSKYLHNWINLFEGKINCIRHDEWAAQIEFVLNSFDSITDCYKFIYQAISLDWNMDANHLPKLLGLHIEDDYILKELNQLSSPVRISQRLIIFSVLDTHGLLHRNTDYDSDQYLLNFNQQVQIQNEQSLFNLLKFEIFNHGFPIALARPILEGQPLWAISKQTSINRIKIRNAIACLPDNLMADIFNSQHWGNSSWQQAEMRRRSIAKIQNFD